MTWEYLSHLARIGSRDIHPGRAWASARLIATLELQPGLRVLEIGCGTGMTLVRVAHAEEVAVTGFDMLPEMLAQAARRVRRAGLTDRIQLVQGLMSTLPFADEAFDRVYCESVIAFQSNAVLRATLREVRRVLRPGGVFIANEGIWKPGVDPSVVRRVNADCLRDFGLPQATEEAWDRDDWLREFQAAGLGVRSADLLVEHVTDADTNDAPATLGIAATLGSWLQPRRLAERWRYRRLLRRYRPDSRHVEGRLFVAERR